MKYVFRSVVECWSVLAQDPALSADIIEHFLQLMNNAALYDEQTDREKLRIAALQPLAVSNYKYNSINDRALLKTFQVQFWTAVQVMQLGPLTYAFLFTC